MIAWGLYVSVACVRAVAGCVQLLSFDAGVQAKSGPFTEGVDLPSKRAAQRAGRKGRSGRQACPKGKAVA